MSEPQPQEEAPRDRAVAILAGQFASALVTSMARISGFYHNTRNFRT